MTDPNYHNEFMSSGNDNNDNMPFGTKPPVASVTWNEDGTEKSRPESQERYASVEEMRSEFGSYRVNSEVENLKDSAIADSPSSDEVVDDPFLSVSDSPEGK